LEEGVFNLSLLLLVDGLPHILDRLRIFLVELIFGSENLDVKALLIGVNFDKSKVLLINLFLTYSPSRPGIGKGDIS
jgi:hypothetical protein